MCKGPEIERSRAQTVKGQRDFSPESDGKGGEH